MNYKLKVIFRIQGSDAKNVLQNEFKDEPTEYVLDMIDNYAGMSECERIELYLVTPELDWLLHAEDILHDGKRVKPAQPRFGQSKVFHSFGNLPIRVSGNTGPFGGSIPLTATITLKSDD